jgi:recombination endonuclease VII
MVPKGGKKCHRCGSTKPLDEFGKNRQAADGLSFYCKQCVNEDTSRRYRARQAAAGKTVRERGAERASRGPVPVGTKWCNDCGSYVPLSDFPRNRSAADGLAFYCKTHQNARTYESRRRVHGGSRHYHLVRRYGVSAAQVAAWIESQGGVCPICLTGLDGKAHVDHDHETGEVRGILCFNCNGGLGQFGDNVRRLQRAIDYLRGELQAPQLIAPGVYDMTAFYERPGA